MLMMFPMFPFDPMPAEDVAASRKFIKFLLDFLRNGKSTLYPEWKPVTENDASHLELNSEYSMKQDLPFSERIAFWRKQQAYFNHTITRAARDEL